MADSFQLKAILSAVDNLTPVLKGVQSIAKSTKKYLGDLGSSINGLTSKFGVPLGILSTIAAGFGVASIKKAVVDFAALGEEIHKGALKAGASKAEYQKLKYVFDQAGVPAEALQGSLSKLNKNLGNAAMNKNASLVDLFKTLHIPMRDANGQMRSAADLLPNLATAFVKNRDPIRQAAMGTVLFGKAWAEMAPLLNEGSEGIAESLDRFNRLKGVISDEDVEGGREFGKQLKDLSFVTKGFQMTIAKELVPTLRPMLASFIEWAGVNKKLISKEVKKIVQELGDAIGKVDWKGFVASVGDFGRAIGKAVDDIGGLKNALIALAIIMNLPTIAAIVGLIGSLGRLGLALVGLVPQATKASVALAEFAAAQATISTALTASLATAAKSAGLIAAAGLIGYAIGTAIYKVLLEDTRVGDWLGEKVAQTLAFFGNAEAKAALATNARLAANVPTLSSGTAAAAGAAGMPFGQGGGAAGAANSAAALLPSSPTVKQGALGSGTFNLNAPATATLNGKLDINFKDAPPGMRVEQAKSDGPRVAINTNVGHRSFATGMP